MRTSDRSALSQNALRWIAVLLLAALLTVAWFQHRWLEQLHAAQVESQMVALTNNLKALQEGFDHHFFSWALAQEVALAELVQQPGKRLDPVDDLDATVVARYYRLQADHADEPWHRLEMDGSSTPLDEPPEIVRQLPGSFSSLLPMALGPERLVMLLAEILPAGTLANPARDTAYTDGRAGTLRSTGPVMVVILDRQQFMARVLEPIVERFLPLRSTMLDYAVVEVRDELEEIIFGSPTSLTLAGLVAPDGEARLLQLQTMMHLAAQLVEPHAQTSQDTCLDCESPAPFGLGFLAGETDRHWLLRVRAREGSMTRLIDQLRVRNLWVSVSGVAILGAAIVLLVVLTARVQRLARTQMEFVSSVSHELRTPLAVMASAASNLAGGLVEGPQQIRQYGDVLSQETRRLRELVERVLTFAKLEEGGFDVSAVDVASVIERVVAAHSDTISERELTLEVRVPAGLPAVQANATALESALRNLVDNAIRHGAGGGRLRIEAQVEVAGPGGELRLSVQDWGEGIEVTERTRLFEPFFRGRRARNRQIPGTGLGLSLVSKIVAALGGRVRIRSGSQAGAIFDLLLPLASTPGSSP